MQFINPDTANNFPEEYAFNETPNNYPPHRLFLKIGAIVILLKNWSVSEGLCNGTRMTVVEIHHNYIKCSIKYGPNKDKVFAFTKTVFNMDQKKVTDLIIRTQFPFRLAFAMTINKAQGQTFDRVGLLLREPVFAHGQLYVWASRGKTFDSLKVLVGQIDHGQNKQGEIEGYSGIYTKNIVEKSILD